MDISGFCVREKESDELGDAQPPEDIKLLKFCIDHSVQTIASLAAKGYGSLDLGTGR